MVNSRSEVNAIHLSFAKQLGLPVRSTDVGTQKIDNITLDTYKMIVIDFLVVDKANRVRFFEEIFLVADVNPKVVFGIFFFILSGTNVDFLDWELE